MWELNKKKKIKEENHWKSTLIFNTHSMWMLGWVAATIYVFVSSAKMLNTKENYKWKKKKNKTRTRESSGLLLRWSISMLEYSLSNGAINKLL